MKVLGQLLINKIFSFCCDIMIKEELTDFLKGYTKLVIMGIGNDIRADDGLGPYIVENIKDLASSKVSIINATTAPENFTGKIRKLDPSHILIIDAVIMNEGPGKIKLVKKEEVAGVSISTHSMSLSYLVNYLEIEKPYNILFIGIEPESMELGKGLSPLVKSSSDDLISIFREIL